MRMSTPATTVAPALKKNGLERNPSCIEGARILVDSAVGYAGLVSVPGRRADLEHMAVRTAVGCLA